jgi:hypothetical protein
MDDAVAHDDVEAERAPVVLLDRGDDAAANVVVVGCRVRGGSRLMPLVSISVTISSSVASSITVSGSLVMTSEILRPYS